MANYQQILTRGQQTVGLWQHFAPALSYGSTLTLAGHQADVAAMPGADQTVVNAEAVIDEKRDARDAAVRTIKELALRVPRLAANSLPPEDSLQDDIEQIQRVVMNSDETILDRGRATLTVWKGTNTHRAAATPALPALTLPKAGGGTWAVAALEAALAGIAALEQQVKDAAAPLSAARSARRALSTRVDRSNKRWFEAWGAHFPAGTAEHDALSQITTETGGGGENDSDTPPSPPPPPPPPTLPETATLAGIAPGGTGEAVLTGMAAVGATSFQVEDQPPGGEFVNVGTGLPGPDATISGLVSGEHLLRVAGENTAGVGPWSEPVAVTVA